MKIIPERHGWMRQANGERNWSVNIDGCKVLVQGENAERVSEEIQKAFTYELGFPDSLIGQAAALFQLGSLLGKRVSAGRWTPAVADGFSWCVLDLQGSPLVLCHDAALALSWFNELEAKADEAFAWDLEALRAQPYQAPSDEDVEADRFVETATELYHRGLVERHEVDAALTQRAA